MFLPAKRAIGVAIDPSVLAQPKDVVRIEQASQPQTTGVDSAVPVVYQHSTSDYPDLYVAHARGDSAQQ